MPTSPKATRKRSSRRPTRNREGATTSRNAEEEDRSARVADLRELERREARAENDLGDAPVDREERRCRRDHDVTEPRLVVGTPIREQSGGVDHRARLSASRQNTLPARPTCCPYWQRMKRCGRCGSNRPAEKFHRRHRGLQTWCKTCRRQYDADYWRRTRSDRIQMRKVHRRELLAWYRELKSAPCVDCGNSFHHAAMHWDHLPGRSKRLEVSNMVARGFRRRTILEEIAKCELVCANCHAVRTFDRSIGV